MEIEKKNGKGVDIIYNILWPTPKKIFDKKMTLKSPTNLKKMLRKSPASNPWAAISKNTDFS